MFKINRFDDWISDNTSGTYGSGASEKVWLINPITGNRGLFKFPKIKSDGNVTGEYCSEKIASELGNLIGMSCAKIDIGTYKGRIGSMSYNFLQEDEFLNEGVNYIQEKFPNYDRDRFFDTVENLKYNIQMLEQLNIDIVDILKMVIFDALIGNSDRHHSNWGYLITYYSKNKANHFFSPLYDNGSSLCSYVNDKDIKDILRDKNRYNALLDTKSKSCIGWENDRPIRHFELIKKIKENYYTETVKFVRNINEKLTENAVCNLLDNFSDEIISDERKKLLLKFIMDRKNKIIEIYAIDEEMIENE